jgi:hypothetical protein
MPVSTAVGYGPGSGPGVSDGEWGATFVWTEGQGYETTFVYAMRLGPNGTAPPTDAGVGPSIGNALRQNVPNPFNPSTRIEYSLREDGPVTLRVFDVRGRLVRTLVEAQRQTAGAHYARWRGIDDSGNPLPSGIYFYRLSAGSYKECRKMVLLR